MRKKLLTRIHILGHPVPCFLKMEENWLFLFGNLFFLAFLLSVDCLCLTVSTSSELSKKGWSDKKRSRYCTTVPCITFKAPSSTSLHVKVKWIDKWIHFAGHHVSSLLSLRINEHWGVWLGNPTAMPLVFYLWWLFNSFFHLQRKEQEGVSRRG